MAGIVDEKVTQEALAEFVRERGYGAEELRSGPDGPVIGLTLKGPRKSSTFIPLSEGGFSLSRAKLWADGVDYATARIQRQRQERSERLAEHDGAPAPFGR